MNYKRDCRYNGLNKTYYFISQSVCYSKERKGSNNTYVLCGIISTLKIRFIHYSTVILKKGNSHTHMDFSRFCFRQSCYFIISLYFNVIFILVIVIEKLPSICRAPQISIIKEINSAKRPVIFVMYLKKSCGKC